MRVCYPDRVKSTLKPNIVHLPLLHSGGGQGWGRTILDECRSLLEICTTHESPQFFLCCWLVPCSLKFGCPIPYSALADDQDVRRRRTSIKLLMKNTMASRVLANIKPTRNIAIVSSRLIAPRKGMINARRISSVRTAAR